MLQNAILLNSQSVQIPEVLCEIVIMRVIRWRPESYFAFAKQSSAELGNKQLHKMFMINHPVLHIFVVPTERFIIWNPGML